ncbi:hypothetical protein NLG97_g8124 [Lecanicillium saksenae]|uniref:Uncharacterized protein n=1 Tax=Lecanicillium saksenae TaxID=468837 RepID=A0ACC1QN44_9HYPO|nr:hypothetical protein NLG97_g8124 [Lecanicillium saksenae]
MCLITNDLVFFSKSSSESLDDVQVKHTLLARRAFARHQHFEAVIDLSSSPVKSSHSDSELSVKNSEPESEFDATRDFTPAGEVSGLFVEDSDSEHESSFDVSRLQDSPRPYENPFYSTSEDSESERDSKTGNNGDNSSSEGEDKRTLLAGTGRERDGEKTKSLELHVPQKPMTNAILSPSDGGNQSEKRAVVGHYPNDNVTTESDSDSGSEPEPASSAHNQEPQYSLERLRKLFFERRMRQSRENAFATTQTDAAQPAPKAVEVQHKASQSDETAATTATGTADPITFTPEEMAQLGELLAVCPRPVEAGSSYHAWARTRWASWSVVDPKFLNELKNISGPFSISCLPTEGDAISDDSVELSRARIPVPKLSISTSDATYIVLINGTTKCRKLFWWMHLDIYTRQFLDDVALCERPKGASAKAILGTETEDVEAWEEVMDERTRRILETRFFESMHGRQDAAPLMDEKLERMHDIYLGCYLAVSHLGMDVQPLLTEAASALHQISVALSDLSLEKSLPPPFTPGLRRVVDRSGEFEVASMAFSQMQKRIHEYKAQTSSGWSSAQEQIGRPTAGEQTTGEILGPKVRKVVRNN